MIRVLIADDHPQVRTLLGCLISQAADMVIAAEARDGREVLDKIRAVDVDIILLDLNMPGLSWTETLGQLRQERPEIPVLVVSSCPADLYASCVQRAGASGYLEKMRVPEELISSIRALMRKRTRSDSAPGGRDPALQAGAAWPHE